MDTPTSTKSLLKESVPRKVWTHKRSKQTIQRPNVQINNSIPDDMVSTHKTRSGLLAHVAVDRLECGHQWSGDAEHVPDEPGVQHDLERGIRNGVAKPDPHV